MQHKTLEKPAHPPFKYYFLASSLTAAFENFVFFPAARMAAVLQYSPNRLSILHRTQSVKHLKELMMPNTNTYKDAISSLYKGIWPNILYRITQRNIMYAGQPVIKYSLNEYIGNTVEKHVGKHYRDPMLASIAGMMSGLLEIFFLPLSTTSIRMQTQGCTFKDAWKMGNLYNGSAITAARNVEAATVLYGAASYVRQYFNPTNPLHISFFQELIAASTGAFFSTLLSHPLDTIKTRQQALYGKQSILATMTTIWQQNGCKGFMQGLIPRLATASPRTAFSMAVTNQLVKEITAISEQGLFAKKKPAKTTPVIEEIKQSRPPL